VGGEVRFLLETGEDLRLVVNVVDALIGVHQHFAQYTASFECEQLLELQEILR
jgi:hypothetical protein